MLTTTINYRVVDLFHQDAVTSFTDAAAAGLWGVIHKATTGATGTDACRRRFCAKPLKGS